MLQLAMVDYLGPRNLTSNGRCHVFIRPPRPPGLLDCVQYRKRQMWEAVHRERNRRVLDLLERFGGADIGGLRETETIWPSVLPSDVDGSVRNAVALVQSGIQSRRTANAALGGADPEGEMPAN